MIRLQWKHMYFIMWMKYEHEHEMRARLHTRIRPHRELRHCWFFIYFLPWYKNGCGGGGGGGSISITHHRPHIIYALPAISFHNSKRIYWYFYSESYVFIYLFYQTVSFSSFFSSSSFNLVSWYSFQHLSVAFVTHNDQIDLRNVNVSRPGFWKIYQNRKKKQ